MYLSPLLTYYRFGTFVFTIALLFSFQIVGPPYAMPDLVFILIVYAIIAFFRLIIKRGINYFDFLLDIVFISAMIYKSFGFYTYLTLLYLFPIFFSSVLIKTKKIFLFPVVSILLYGIIYYISGDIFERDSVLNISLHLFSFSLIAFAGDNLKNRIENLDKYIKQLEEERIKMQGFERLYKVSADLAHELKNPLTSISAAVQFLKEGRYDREFIEMLDTETVRLKNLVNDFLLFSRPSDAPKEYVNLKELIELLIGIHRSNKKIEFNSDGNIEIYANRTFMEVAISNIIKNAVEASNSLVNISLKVESSVALNMKFRGIGLSNKDRELIIIDIEDDGPGINKDIEERIFEPFVTTKSDGTGLGLAISYRIILNFGGNIYVGKSSLGGAKFTIVFPKEENRV